MNNTNIVMIAKDRPLLTTQALTSMALTSLKPSLTLLDDCSEIGNSVLFQHCCNLLDRREWEVDYTHPAFPTGGAGAARNLAISNVHERHDFLYCSDNDVYFHPGWLEVLIAIWPFARSMGFAVIGAYNHPFHQPAREVGGLIENVALASQSWFMEWKTWDRFGPLVENPGVRQSDDVEFTDRIRAAGFKVGKTKPNWVVNTGITDSFGVEIPGAEYVKGEIPIGVFWE